ncbi:hypothetical protein FXO38_01036 [Capsicum annuum]|nr:hypothetical protein FXO38_01036 [Capsicum annuum]
MTISKINQVSLLIDAGITRAWPTRKGVDGLKASATIICKEHRIGKIRADEDPMPTASTAYENPDRHSWTKTSHDEARKVWDTGVAFRFTSRTECEGAWNLPREKHPELVVRIKELPYSESRTNSPIVDDATNSRHEHTLKHSQHCSWALAAHTE